MMARIKLLGICVVCLCCASAIAQVKQKPVVKAKVPLKQRLQATEDKFAKMAASSGKAADQLSKIEAELDQLIKSLHDMRMRFEKKPNS
jgi:chromosome segregation ATPase